VRSDPQPSLDVVTIDLNAYPYLFTITLSTQNPCVRPAIWRWYCHKQCVTEVGITKSLEPPNLLAERLQKSGEYQQGATHLSPQAETLTVLGLHAWSNADARKIEPIDTHKRKEAPLLTGAATILAKGRNMRAGHRRETPLQSDAKREVDTPL
jgi:hypothetical protein